MVYSEAAAQAKKLAGSIERDVGFEEPISRYQIEMNNSDCGASHRLYALQSPYVSCAARAVAECSVCAPPSDSR